MKICKTIGVLLALAGCLALIVLGHRGRGPLSLLIMLAGLAGLLVLLWLYNRLYTKEERRDKKRRGKEGGTHEA